MSLSAAASAQGVEPPRLELTLEAERLHYSYHFTNPSSFDTAALVPHFFEQDYRVTNLWLVGDARYTAGIPWRTTAGVTPARDGSADDYDTFFDPGGTVIVSGTTGPARLQAFRVSQSGEVARAGRVRISAGYRFRLDRADFGVGHKTVTRDGVLVAALDVTTPEMTSSQIQEVFAAAAVAGRIGGRWRLFVDGDVSPATRAQLTVRLPEKYPGQDLVVQTRAVSAAAQIRAVRTASVPVAIVFDAGGIWSYGEDNAIAFGRLALGVSFGIR